MRVLVQPAQSSCEHGLQHIHNSPRLAQGTYTGQARCWDCVLNCLDMYGYNSFDEKKQSLGCSKKEMTIRNGPI